jgi:hypothetical protein
MSWFGFGKKEKKPTEPTAEDIAKGKSMQAERTKLAEEKTLEDLQIQSTKYEQKMESISGRIGESETQMKGCMRAGDKVKAKKFLKQKKMLQDQLIDLQGKQGFLDKQIIQVQSIQDNSSMVNVVKDANKIIQKGNEANEDLRDALEQARDNEAEQTMAREEMNQ